MTGHNNLLQFKRVTQKSFCKENNPCQNMLWQGLLVLKVGFWVSPLNYYIGVACKAGFPRTAISCIPE